MLRLRRFSCYRIRRCKKAKMNLSFFFLFSLSIRDCSFRSFVYYCCYWWWKSSFSLPLSWWLSHDHYHWSGKKKGNGRKTKNEIDSSRVNFCLSLRSIVGRRIRFLSRSFFWSLWFIIFRIQSFSPSFLCVTPVNQAKRCCYCCCCVGREREKKRRESKYLSDDDQSNLTCAHIDDFSLSVCVSFDFDFCLYHWFRNYIRVVFFSSKAPVMCDDASTAYICIYCPFNSDNLQALEKHLASAHEHGCQDQLDSPNRNAKATKREAPDDEKVNPKKKNFRPKFLNL